MYSSNWSKESSLKMAETMNSMPMPIRMISFNICINLSFFMCLFFTCHKKVRKNTLFCFSSVNYCFSLIKYILTGMTSELFMRNSLWNCINQFPCVIRLRVLAERVGFTSLHDDTLLHHCDAVGHELHHRQVM